MKLTVTELNRKIKLILENNQELIDVILEGEISNLKLSNGHYFFAIKDEHSLIKCIIYSSNAKNIPNIENGAKVIIRSSISVYPKRGEYSLIVKTLALSGIGALHQKYLDTKKFLTAKGVFNNKYKKVIPKFPLNIGIVTSATGAAVEDIIKNCHRRWPIAKLWLFPAIVQGPKSATNIATIIKKINEDFLNTIDVLIIGRGGGSFEDLYSFSELVVVKAIFYSKIPIIAAVGHENDESLSEFVADMSASTPTGAAEAATPNINKLIESMDISHNRLQTLINNKLNIAKNNLKISMKALLQNRTIMKLENSITNKAEQLQNLAHDKLKVFNTKINNQYFKINNSINKLIVNKSHNFTLSDQKLNIINPKTTLSKGYAALEVNGKIIKSINDININDKIRLTLLDGNALATVNKINKVPKYPKE